MSVPLPGRDCRALIALSAISALGCALLAWRRSWKVSGVAWLGLGLAWAGTVAGLLLYNLKFVQPQGRYLFPALAPIAIFYVAGWAALFPRRAQPAAVAALSLAMIAFSTYTLQHDLLAA